MTRPWFALVCVSCVDGPGVETVTAAPDYDTFVSDVQPIFEARCANPACHGSPERPLEVYAVHQHRMDPALLYADDPLTDAESHENFQRACAFLIGVDDPMDCALVSRPLGDIEHGGGAIWADDSTAEVQVVIRWVEQGLWGASP